MGMQVCAPSVLERVRCEIRQVPDVAVGPTERARGSPRSGPLDEVVVVVGMLAFASI